MKDKKLCFVIPSFGIGGIEINFQKLANHFNWSGYDVHIMYHAEEDNGSFQSNFHEEIELDKLPKRKFLGNVFGYLKYFNKKKPAFVVVGMYVVAMQLIVARFISNHKPKIIINGSAHLSSIIQYDESIKTRIILKILSKIFFSKADAIVCQSNGIKEDLLKNFSISPEKLITIYNGVLTKNNYIHYKQTNVHRWLTPETKNFSTIIMAGRLEPQKCIVEFVDIFYAIQEKINVKMIIIGEGILKNKLVNRIKSLNLDSLIDIVDFQENFNEYIKASDVFVVNSNYEGFNNMIVHALSSGTTVISRNCPSGPSEILCDGKYGFLVQPNDDKKMISTIISALKKPSFKTEDLIERSKLFTVEKCAAEFENLFNKI
jgi:glycosyltransferase involved in cell wall biosynthesis